MSQNSDNNVCVVGLSWGDEGKGKIVDLLCESFDYIIRFNGGANAGHTVCIGKEKFALHLLPSGVLRSDKQSVIGPGVVVDPTALVEEIDALADRGLDLNGRLHLSDRAHLVLPYHKMEDSLGESAASDSERIGTTSRGIGPCYADKMKRWAAIRVAELENLDALESRLRDIVKFKSRYLSAAYGRDPGLNADEIIQHLRIAADRLGPFVSDTTTLLQEAVSLGRRLLFESANGALLDVDHGTYPFVTSSGTTASGVAAGTGLPVQSVGRVVGVAKTYTTRVGGGPFVSELNDEIGNLIRTKGNEFGTTTGRPRRCGWFDTVSIGYSSRFCGANEIALMHLDTLSGFREVGICTAYDCGGQRMTTLPALADKMERATPVFETMPGWSGDISRCDKRSDLPPEAQQYLERLESLIGLPITIISVGPERSQTIVESGAVLPIDIVMEDRMQS